MNHEASGATEEERAVLGLLAARVRARFALTADAFADQLVAQARTEGGGAPAVTYIARLSLDDLYLAKACAQGDESAWEECAARHFGFIRDFARSRLRGPQADDVADQVIADLWHRGKLARFSGRSSLRTWLGAVVSYAAVNAARAARLSHRPGSLARAEAAGTVLRLDGEAAEVEERTAAALADLVFRALEALAPPDRLLLLLYFEQGMTLDEIATVAGRSKAALSRRLKRLYEALRGDVERLARVNHASDSGSLRSGLDLGRVPLDLARALSSERSLEGSRGDGV